jgi:hypothetical protein
VLAILAIRRSPPAGAGRLSRCPLLATDLAAADNPALRPLAYDGCWYLIIRGDSRTGYDLASALLRQWRGQLGEDHEHMQVITNDLGWALRERAAMPRPATWPATS